ncbi:hypothetical protein ABTY59_31930 [Streptomyces sp. NPDC096079]|uniref:hypothetical protein n=1 Tax=Streptomyces sp. NPDC096079 TaxID=3155820 RepID=UPI0033274BF9
MNKDRARSAAEAALRDAQTVEGQERTHALLTALTHAVLALSAPEKNSHRDDALEEQDLLLNGIREQGGRWDWRRAADWYAYLKVHPKREARPSSHAKARLKSLQQGGYLVEVEKDVYELAPTPGGEQ